MRRVYKYKLPKPFETKAVTLPSVWRKLHIDLDPQDVSLVMWAEVSDNSETCQVSFAVIPTGDSPPDSHAHIGTVITDTIMGRLVWHVYYKPL